MSLVYREVEVTLTRLPFGGEVSRLPVHVFINLSCSRVWGRVLSGVVGRGCIRLFLLLHVSRIEDPTKDPPDVTVCRSTKLGLPVPGFSG